MGQFLRFYYIQKLIIFLFSSKVRKQCRIENNIFEKLFKILIIYLKRFKMDFQMQKFFSVIFHNSFMEKLNTFH